MATIVVYHSGWELAAPEGPFQADVPPEQLRGVDRFIRQPPGGRHRRRGNVYAELGSTWFNLSRDLDSAGRTCSASC